MQALRILLALFASVYARFATAQRMPDSQAMARSIDEAGCASRNAAALLACGRRRDILKSVAASRKLTAIYPTWVIGHALLACALCKAGRHQDASTALANARSSLQLGRQMDIAGYADAVRVASQAVDAACLESRAMEAAGGE